jgi:hypothetical protein
MREGVPIGFITLARRTVQPFSPSAPIIGKLEDLAGKTVYVRKSSSYYEHLSVLNESFASQGLKGIDLLPAEEDLEDEDLLEMVNAGIFPFAVVDDHVAQIWAKLFKSITVRKDLVIYDKGAIAGRSAKTVHCSRQRLAAFFRKKPRKTHSPIGSYTAITQTIRGSCAPLPRMT